MTREDLYESMNGIDDEILEHSESARKPISWKKWRPVAACFLAAGVVALGLWIITCWIYTGEPARDWAPVYNPFLSMLGTEDMPMDDPYAENLSALELLLVTPRAKANWMHYDGIAVFEKEDLRGVVLRITTTDPEAVVRVSMGPRQLIGFGYMDIESTVSKCGNVAYTLGRSVTGLSVYLQAKAKINGVDFYFEAEGSLAKEEQITQDFETVLECFTTYGIGEPWLSVIRPKGNPEWFRYDYTLLQGQMDDRFGKYTLKELPVDCGKVGVVRERSKYTDSLSVYCYRGNGVLSWIAADYRPEFDAWLTSATDRESYDLSMNGTMEEEPIFELEELTMEVIRARMDCATYSSEADMCFGAKCGNTVIWIYWYDMDAEKDPQWLYEQLMKIA